jgi:hypothetical protein
MASMSTRKKLEFNNDDQYNTTREIWSSIADYIPSDKIIWEAFMLGNTSSKSVEILRNMGKTCIGYHDIDVFVADYGDIRIKSALQYEEENLRSPSSA